MVITGPALLLSRRSPEKPRKRKRVELVPNKTKDARVEDGASGEVLADSLSFFHTKKIGLIGHNRTIKSNNIIFKKKRSSFFLGGMIVTSEKIPLDMKHHLPPQSNNPYTKTRASPKTEVVYRIIRHWIPISPSPQIAPVLPGDGS